MEQLLIAYTSNRRIDVLENNKVVKSFYNVRYGKKGCSLEKDMIEGGMKTPLGLYNLGVSFGVHDLKLKYPYIKISNNSYWVDDYRSPYYNSFVEVNGNVLNYDYSYINSLDKKLFSSAEHLIDYPKAYEYGIFIEYNVFNKLENGLGNNKGSAIFLHCFGDNDYTLGCLAISRDDMKWLLNFLDRGKNPKILIK